MREFKAAAITSEILSPEEYLLQSQQDRNNIDSVDIVIPKLGSKSFGGLRVHYTTPVYEVLRNKK